jgi:aminoglycoside phosphotransferase (APT) family kinase protein
MKREYKVLSRLWRKLNRAPRAFLFCEDPTVAGADLFVMERRRGEVIRGVIPATVRKHADVGRRTGTALVAAIAERQLQGWKKRWDLVADLDHDEAMG